MAYTHYRVESPVGTIRKSGRANGALRVVYDSSAVETITTATTIDKSCSNKMMKSDIVFSDINWTENSRISCGNKIMPDNLKIITSTTDYGTYQIITTSGTWVCPVDVTSINVFCVGGGGAGGMSSSRSSGSTDYSYGGAGGGGGYCSNTILTVVPGTEYTVTIGAGGVHSTSRSTSGGNGGTTSFALNSNILAYANGGNAAVLTDIPSGGIHYYLQKDGGNGGAGGGGAGLCENQPESTPSYYSGGNGGTYGGNGASVGSAEYTHCTGGTGQGSSAVYSSVTGVYYSGGGGGGTGSMTGGPNPPGTGGYYGGGNGGYHYYAGANGENASGGGGGGAGFEGLGGNGGTGIMIISWS